MTPLASCPGGALPILFGAFCACACPFILAGVLLAWNNRTRRRPR
jgi:hypothetical protein